MTWKTKPSNHFSAQCRFADPLWGKVGYLFKIAMVYPNLLSWGTDLFHARGRILRKMMLQYATIKNMVHTQGKEW